jgi:hypothetical protein
MYSRVSFHFCESARSQKEPQAKMLGAMKFDALPYLGSVLGGRGGRGDEVPPEPGLIKLIYCRHAVRVSGSVS